MKEIFNIFSRRKIKQPEKPKITVDYREKNSLVVSGPSPPIMPIVFIIKKSLIHTLSLLGICLH